VEGGVRGLLLPLLPGELRAVTKDLNQGSRYPCRSSNWVPSKYKSEALAKFCIVTVDN
jgi:hypothetical protein